MTTTAHFTHGWNTCRKCHDPNAEVSRNGKWHMRANPGYWGSEQPKVLVLGFSKGANQIKAANDGDFDKVAFAKMRPRLHHVLTTLGLSDPAHDMDALLSAASTDLGAASLLRCGLSIEVNGKLETSGPIIAMSLKDSWTHDRIEACVRQHLLEMPQSVKHVVLLGNDDRYVEGVKTIMRTVFADCREVNSMSFRARGALWIFVVHPSPANGHFKDWAEEGTGKQATKCRAARAAVGQTSVLPPVAVSASLIIPSAPVIPAPSPLPARSIPKLAAQSQPSSRSERYAKTFQLVGTRGEAIYPIRQARGNPVFILAKRGTGSHHKEFKIEVDEEERAYQMVASGTYKIRAIREGDKAPSLLGVGDIAVRTVVRI